MNDNIPRPFFHSFSSFPSVHRSRLETTRDAHRSRLGGFVLRSLPEIILVGSIHPIRGSGVKAIMNLQHAIKKQSFGITGMHVGRLGFGGAEIGFEGASDHTVDALLGTALEVGINVIDT